MIPDSTDNLPAEKPHPLLRWTLLISVAVVASVAIRGYLVGRPQGGVKAGTVAPAIRAEGWINGPAPSAEDMAGKVIVIDGWASWCGPCRAAAPHLIEIHRKYRDRGVIFLGLTSEDAGSLRDIEQFVQDTGIPWPNGYGAGETLSKLGMEWIPAIWIIGWDGTIAWYETNPRPKDLEAAIERALAR